MPQPSLRHALVALAGSVLLACSPAAPEPPTPTPVPAATPVPRPVYEVQRGDVERRVTFAGQMAGLSQERLAFATQGIVQEISVAPGDAVSPGQILARLDQAAAQEQLATLQSELDLMEQDAARAQRKAELALEIAQRTLELYRQQGRSALELEIAGLQVELAQLDLDDVTGNADLESRRQAVADLQGVIASSVLTSPMESHVLEVLVAPGRSAGPDTPVLSLGDPQSLEVRAWLPVEQLAPLREGMPITITANDGAALPDLSATIRSLPPPQGHSKDSAVHITPGSSAAAAGYQLGDRVQLTTVTERRDDVLWLPPQAVNSVAGRTFVIIQDGDTQRSVDVEIGLVTPQRVEIVEGLAEGQTVFGS